MSELTRHAQTLGLIFSTFLLLVMLLLGVFALWEWWYIAQLAVDDAMAIGTAVRLAPAVIAGVVFFFGMGALLMEVGRTTTLRVICRHRWRFTGAFVVMLGILCVAFQVLRLGASYWGEQDEQIVSVGGVIAGLVFLIAVIGSIGFKVARQLDE